MEAREDTSISEGKVYVAQKLNLPLKNVGRPSTASSFSISLAIEREDKPNTTKLFVAD